METWIMKYSLST